MRRAHIHLAGLAAVLGLATAAGPAAFAGGASQGGASDPALTLPVPVPAAPVEELAAGSAVHFVLLVEPGTTTESLARAWAVLSPEFTRASPDSMVVQLRIAPGFDPDAVSDLLRATRGVVRAEREHRLEPAAPPLATPAPTAGALGEAVSASGNATQTGETPLLPAPTGTAPAAD